MPLKKCSCGSMYGKADDGCIHKHCSHCHSDSHWKEHTDRRSGDVTIICHQLKKEKRERRAQINNNRAEKTFKKKTVAELKELPWDMLKQVKEHKLNKLCLNSMSINFLQEWRSKIVKEAIETIKPKKSKKSRKKKTYNEEVFMTEPEDKKFKTIENSKIQQNTTQAAAPPKLTRQLTGLHSWAQIAK